MIRLLLGGCDGDAGKAHSIKTSIETTHHKDGQIEWMRISFLKLRLFNNAHMYLMQGMAIAQLLMAASLVLPDGTALPGPLLYVTGFPSEMWEVPFFYRGLVVGKVLSVPETLTTSELLLTLFNAEMARLKK